MFDWDLIFYFLAGGVWTGFCMIVFFGFRPPSKYKWACPMKDCRFSVSTSSQMWTERIAGDHLRYERTK